MIRAFVFLAIIVASFTYVFRARQTNFVGASISVPDVQMGRITRVDVNSRQITIHGVALSGDDMAVPFDGAMTLAAQIHFEDLRIGDFIRAKGMTMGDTFIATDLQKYPRLQWSL